MSQQTGRIPTRTCVVCREKRQRNELFRLVRTPEGEIVFDETGRMDGRGAYVCRDADHWGASHRGEGVDRGRLRGALKTGIDDLTVETLNNVIKSHLAEQQNE